MLPPAAGCGPREVRRWTVSVLEHFELAVQLESRERLSCEAIASGRNGTATAQLASTMTPAAKIANLNVFELADEPSGRDVIHWLPCPLAFALQSGCGGLTASYGQKERRINFNDAISSGAQRACLSYPIAAG
jgi:hypothetical protein